MWLSLDYFCAWFFELLQFLTNFVTMAGAATKLVSVEYEVFGVVQGIPFITMSVMIYNLNIPSLN